MHIINSAAASGGEDTYATFNIPETLVTGNGSSFTSYEFTEYMKSIGIHDIRTASYNHAISGLVQEHAIEAFNP